MFRQLGAKLDWPNPKLYFLHPCDNKIKVFYNFRCSTHAETGTEPVGITRSDYFRRWGESGMGPYSSNAQTAVKILFEAW